MKVLIVKLSSLGDVVQTMPVVHDVQQHFAAAEIDWVVEEAFAPLVQRQAGVRRVLPIAERRWRKSRWSAATQRERAAFDAALRSEAYDAVIDFQGLIKSALVARRARRTTGGFSATYANASDACSYEWPVRYLLQRTLPMPRRIHAVARYRLLAARALGFESHGAPVYDLHATPTEPLRSVVLAHGTTRADNEWPEDQWLALAERLVSQGFRIGLPQSNDTELALVTRIAHNLRGHADVWPRMALPQVLDAMAASSGVIGVDSGLSHLAVALNLPHVQIFSQPRAWRAGPVGQPHQLAVGGESAPDVEAVWAAWQAVA
ncbi:lipopolysaccharide heptosyltransferase I [Rhodoferax sp.]|jgi:heptosyltransferase-1|uniref:lipopolysaccharide heptosyltransferase I n=1 Tax=Rhodoferax sp. TaxID=50421 RepID=UPI003783CEEF